MSGLVGRDRAPLALGVLHGLSEPDLLGHLGPLQVGPAEAVGAARSLSPALRALGEEAEAAAPGRAYLLRKRLQQLSDDEADHVVDEMNQVILDEMYLAALARAPLPGEISAALGHVNKGADKRKAWEDVLWALINTREFLFRH